MRVVVDGNVVVSAALPPGGTCRLALAEATRNHQILLSEAIPGCGGATQISALNVKR